VNDASLALAARVVLAAVLAVSAASKLQSRAAVRDQMDSLVSARLVPIVAPALPVVEIVVALGLVLWWTPVPGIVALALLGVFTVVLVRAQARHVPCLCFGASGSSVPVGPASVIRNGVLAALAVIAIGDPSGAYAAATIVAGIGFGAIAALAVRASR
jgi:hypothetical protein